MSEQLTTVERAGGTVTRVDTDHYPAWIDENPALFAQSVRRFLEDHPAELWDCRIGKHTYLIRLTATRKASREMSRQQWNCEGKDGTAELIINLNDDPDDSASTSILVRGRNREEVAKRLAELLNRQAFVGA